MVIAAHEVRPIPTMGIPDFGRLPGNELGLVSFLCCAVVGLPPVSLQKVPLPICLDGRLAPCPGLAAAGKSGELFLKQQYPLLLEILGLLQAQLSTGKPIKCQ